MIVSIIELHSHPEVIKNLFNLLSFSREQFCIYTLASLWDKTGIEKKTDNINVSLQTGGESKYQFLKRVRDEINSSDLVFINTIQFDYRLYALQNFIPPIVLRVHNLNSTFRPFYSFLKSAWLFDLKFQFIYISKYLIWRRNWYFQRKFIKSVSKFNFPSSTLSRFAIEKCMVSPEKVGRPLIPFTASFRYSSLYHIDQDRVLISIIGAVEKRRRNYSIVLDSFKELVKNLKRPVSLAFLGRTSSGYGNRMIDEFRKLENDFFKIISYSAFVPVSEFDDMMHKTHFIIIPAVEKIKTINSLEYYGKTKISGNINDIIEYGKAAILPDHYPVDEELQPIIASYSKMKSLTDILTYWITEQPYLSFDYDKVYSKYEPEKISRDLIRQFRDVAE